MPTMTVVRVNALPAEPTPNTVYLVKLTDGLQIAICGNDGVTIAKTYTSTDIEALVTQAVGNMVFNWDTLPGKPDTFTPSAHHHGSTDINDLNSAVSSIIANYLSTTGVPWGDISNPPTIPSKTGDLTNDAGFVNASQAAAAAPIQAVNSKTGPNVVLSVSDIEGALAASLVGIANGLAPLDSTNHIPAVFLPSYMDLIEEFPTKNNFPATGSASVIYLDQATEKIWRWGSSVYVEISPSPGSTDSVAEGAVNLYFTAARAQAAVTTITGNAGTATKLATACKIAGVNFDGSTDIAIPFANLDAKPSTIAGYGITDLAALVATYAAATADRLTNSRTIAGVSFNGSADIAIPFANLDSKPNTIGGYGITDFAAQVAAYITANGVAWGSISNPPSIATKTSQLTNDAAFVNAAQAAAAAPIQTVNGKGGPNPVLAVADIAGAVASSIIGAANGVAPLGSDSRIPSAYLPSYMDLIEEFATKANFPTTGSASVIYLDQSTEKIWRWGGSIYIEVSPSPGSTDSVAEGAVNLYFTAARAQAAVTTISGNAGTATKLATARKIAGVYFDGSADINIPYANITAPPTTVAGLGLTDFNSSVESEVTGNKRTFSTQQAASGTTLTDAATIAWDGDINGQVVSVTTTAARTFGAPTNILPKAAYVLELTTGGFTPAWNAAFKWAAGGSPSNLASGTYIFTFIGGAGNTLLPTGPGYLTGA